MELAARFYYLPAEAALRIWSRIAARKRDVRKVKEEE
jgi:hypothetical protein